MIDKIAFWFLVVASAACFVGLLMKMDDFYDTSDDGMYLIIGFVGFAFCATMLAARIGYLS